MSRTKSTEEHNRDVDRLCEQIKNLEGSATLKRSSTSNVTRPFTYKKGHDSLNLSSLDGIVGINTEKMVVHVEPRVTMEKLVAATLKHGLIPAVVPEFRGITVGGAISGAGLESSSHKFGLFSDACKGYEVVLGSGEKIVCSPDKHADLFYALPGSYGSLGLITIATVALVPAASHVEVTYFPASSAEEAIDLMHKHRSADFLDAICYSQKQNVVMVGRFTSTPERTTSLKRSWSPWFYQHAYRRVGTTEALPTEDYLFRSDRAAFWMAQYLLDLRFVKAYFARQKPPDPCESFPRYPSTLFRFLFGRYLGSQRLYKALHSLREGMVAEACIIQDLVLPWETSVSFVNECEKRYKVFPIWLCPLKRAAEPQLFAPHSIEGDELTLDVGIYGIPTGWDNAIEATRDLEMLTQESGGRKALYTHSYYSEKKFWEIYDRDLYQNLRSEYHGDEAFLDITLKALRN